MTTETIEKQETLVEYNVTDERIAQLKKDYLPLTCDTPEGYKQVVSAVADLRTLRVDLENDRKDLIAPHVEAQRLINAEAKRITALIREIEDPLTERRRLYDAEKERIKKEKEEAKRKAIEEELRKKREAEEAAERERQEKIRQEQEAERKRIEEERVALEKEKAESARLKQEEEDRLAEIRRGIDEELARLEKVKEEKEVAEQPEPTPVIGRPHGVPKMRQVDKDKAKLLVWATALRQVPVPTVKDEWANEVLTSSLADINSAIAYIENSCRLETTE